MGGLRVCLGRLNQITNAVIQMPFILPHHLLAWPLITYQSCDTDLASYVWIIPGMRCGLYRPSYVSNRCQRDGQGLVFRQQPQISLWQAP